MGTGASPAVLGLVPVEILARGLLNGCRGVLLCYQINFLVKNSVIGDVSRRHYQGSK